MEFFIRTRDGEWCAAKVTADLGAELTAILRKRSEDLRNKEEVDFAPSYHPDDEEVFVISDFALDEHAKNTFENSASAPSLGLGKFETRGVKAFAGIKLDSKGSIQHAVFIALGRSTVIDKSRLHIMFEQNTMTRSTKSSLVIPDRIDAVIFKGKLFFDSYLMANRVLDLMGLVDEATADDIEEFVEDNKFVYDDYDNLLALMDGWCKKRIAIVRDMKILTKLAVSEIVQYGKEHKVLLKTQGAGSKRKIVLPDNRRELKNVLRLLCDDFLDSGLTNKKYRTNSKVQVSS